MDLSFCSFAGISRETLNNWETARPGAYSDTIKRLKTSIAAFKKQLAFAGKIPPIVFATDMNNNHGYTQAAQKIDLNVGKQAAELPTAAEIEVFIQCFTEEEEMYRIIFLMLFWLGCRVGELLALTSEDIDFENGTVSISKTYFRRNKTDYITAPKTESSNRKITIPEFLQKEIKQFLDRQYELMSVERIFPITDRAIQKKMKQKTEQAKLMPFRVHDLRHSHIALLIEKGMQPLVIAQRVGHDSVNTTMNIYGHLYPNKQKQVADLLNAEATGKPENNLVDMETEKRFRKAGGWS